MKTLASLLLLLLSLMLLQRPAHAQFVIVSPSNPEVSGTVAVKLGTIPPTVWWTCIKINSSPGCSASGYNPIAWDTTKVLDGDYNINAYGFGKGGTVPLDILDIVSPFPTTVRGIVSVKLGNIASNVWWTRLCVDGTTQCLVAGYNPLSFNSALIPNGIHDLVVTAYPRGTTTPLGSQQVQVNIAN
jgi:hypothetical protein